MTFNYFRSKSRIIHYLLSLNTSPAAANSARSTARQCTIICLLTSAIGLVFVSLLLRSQICSEAEETVITIIVQKSTLTSNEWRYQICCRRNFAETLDRSPVPRLNQNDNKRPTWFPKKMSFINLNYYKNDKIKLKKEICDELAFRYHCSISPAHYVVCIQNVFDINNYVSNNLMEFLRF